MKYAIIAAGEGSRLAAEGISEPKPLVQVAGECLIDRLIRIFMDNGADGIVVICNDRTPLVAQHLATLQHSGLSGRSLPLQYVVKSTPSSMHSFFEISRYLSGSPFVMTTVDTIFSEEEFGEYIRYFRQSEADGVMGVTEYVDDECPLWVATDGQQNITQFADGHGQCRYVSGGIYGLTPTVLPTLSQCVARGESRMRNFQRALITDGVRLKAFPFSKILDVDHAADIEKANQFLL